ncbi:MAG: UPF0280 family protein [Actinomycetota bacterium]|nr:UPF0280 family protein [Actinomycetota bacterium]
MYQDRFYRDWLGGIDLVKFEVQIDESDLMIAADRNLYPQGLQAVIKYRGQLESYITVNPTFETSLVPVAPSIIAPEIVARMCAAARRANVGPMAAVAGAIAEFVGRDLLKDSKEIIVENGGDIFLKSRKKRRVAVYAGDSPLSGKVAVVIESKRTPIGICTSAGSVGHSLSLGRADAALVISKDTILADAAATAIGNLIHDPGDIEEGLQLAKRISGVEGALIIMGDKMGAWGEIEVQGI